MITLNRIAGSLIIAAVLAAPTALAGQQAAAESTPRQHVVRGGDTLWALAQHYYDDPLLWPLIHGANRGLVPDPDLILPDQTLVIPSAEARAADALVRPTPDVARPAPTPDAPAAREAAEPAAAVRESAVAVPAREAALPPVTEFGRTDARQAAGQEDRTVFYTSGGSLPDVIAQEAAARPIITPPEFLTVSWLAEEGVLPAVARMVDRLGRDKVDPMLRATAHPYEVIYLETVDGAAAPGERLLMVRPGRIIEGYGQVVVPRGVVRVLEREGGIASALVVEQYEEIAVGDLAVPLPAMPELGSLRPVAIEEGVRGMLLGFLREQPVPGILEQAFIDLGRDQGLRPGDELQVILPARPARAEPDTELPEARVAKLRVLRAGARTSTVKVVDIWQPVLRTGLPVQVTARMPF